MIENDFADLRAAARESVIGQVIAWMGTALSSAFDDATVTRIVRAKHQRIQRAPAEDRVRWFAVTLAVAAAATLGIAQFVAPYLSTTIPASGLMIAAVIFGAAAARPGMVVSQWQHSRLNRAAAWLRD